MKRLLAFLLFLPIISCKSDQEKNITHVDSLVAEIDASTRAIKSAREVDSAIKSDVSRALFDTSGVSTGPIKILSAKLVQREYSNYKDIRLSYKNVSRKQISGIRFKWYGINAFGEPADMGSSSSLSPGFGAGFTDDPLLPGKSSSGTWNILSRDGKKVIAAWPYEVAFEDGSKWKCGKD